MLNSPVFLSKPLMTLLLCVGIILGCNSTKKESVKVDQFFDFPAKKLWKHRVNTAEDALIYGKVFSGLEIDIVYNEADGEFYCNHDTAANPETLASLFEALAKNDSLYFWLDFKSANRGDVSTEQSITDLNTLLTQFKVKNRCIVETFNGEFLIKLKEKGFFTSFWVSQYAIASMTAEEIDHVKNLIGGVIADIQPSALSAHFTMHPFLSENFGNQNLHYWTYGNNPTKDKEAIEAMMADLSTKVVLVDDEQ